MPSNKTRVKDIETNLLYLANVIDDYNNNTISGCAAALALPYQTVAGTSPAQTWAAFLPAYATRSDPTQLTPPARTVSGVSVVRRSLADGEGRLGVEDPLGAASLWAL